MKNEINLYFSWRKLCFEFHVLGNIAHEHLANLFPVLSERYTEKNKEKLREYEQNYKQNDKEKIRERKRKYKQKNKEKHREYNQKYRLK